MWFFFGGGVKYQPIGLVVKQQQIFTQLRIADFTNAQMDWAQSAGDEKAL